MSHQISKVCQYSVLRTFCRYYSSTPKYLQRNNVGSLLRNCYQENINTKCSTRFLLPNYLQNPHPSRHIASSCLNYNRKKNVTFSTSDPNVRMEKLAFELMSEIKHRHRIYKIDFLRFFGKICEIKYVAPQHVALMMSCCTNVLPEVSPEDRIQLLDTIWKEISPFYIFELSNFNDLLKCYKANKHKFQVKTFLEKMHPILPNEETYYNLLGAVCEVGDMNQAQEILSNMKVAKFPLTEECFNNLIEGYGHARDMKMAKSMLEMMESLRIEPSLETQMSLLKAAVCSESATDMDSYIADMRNRSVPLTEVRGMDIVQCLTHLDMKKYIPKILQLFPEELWASQKIPPTINAACVQLVHKGFPEIAYDIYSKFPPPTFANDADRDTYFRKLLRESVKAYIPLEVLTHICCDLVMTEKNPYAFQIILEAALLIGNMNLATDIIKEMNSREYAIRVHYFWPMFINIAKEFGEKGVFDVLSVMNTVQVQPDFDTLVDYILPYINTESSQTAVKKLQNADLPVSVTLTPMLQYELKKNKLVEASELCEIYPVKIDCEHLINPLVQAFFNTQKSEPLFIILDAFIQKPKDDKKDFVGWFLVLYLSSRKFAVDFQFLETILKHFSEKDIRISSVAVDICMSLVGTSKLNFEAKERIKDVLPSLVTKNNNLEVDMFEQLGPHPKDMNLQQLEAHLIELESKKLNTRGVLRKLLQQYCRYGMTSEAKTIVKKCENLQVYFSSGMLASILDVHVKCRDLENAEKYFYNLQKMTPNFNLDEHKILDYVTLLVANDKKNVAISELEKFERKGRVGGGPRVESNCWRLIDTVAKSKDPQETKKFFELLCNLGFCQPSNILLGPLIKCHLYNSDLFGAVDEFEQIVDVYKKTPLKHDLLCRSLVLSSGTTPEGLDVVGDHTKKELGQKCVTKILNCDRKVHGNASSMLSLVMALADCGLKKQLRKYVLDPSVTLNQDSLIKQCERLAEENKANALEVIAECLSGLRTVDTSRIFEITMNVHNLNGDCASATNLWTKMQENDIKPTQKLVKVLGGLLRSHKYDLPPDLIGHLDVTFRTEALES